MYLKRAPEHLSVIVVSAKGLKPRKEGKGKFNVIFGIGENRVSTEITESPDGCPVFNAEHEFIVPDVNALLALKIMDSVHNDVLGQVLVPVASVLNLSREHIRTYSLQPYKKKKVVTGDLNLITWVSKWKVIVEGGEEEAEAPAEDENKSGTLFNLSKIKGLLNHDKQKMESGTGSDNPGSSLALKKKAFSSCNDLRTLTSTSLVSVPDDSVLRKLDNRAREAARRPEISGISPSEGPISGGTRLTIRGRNLGERREDVVGLFVCGSNVLFSLEYVSSNKIHCVTKAWKQCVGNITVDTQTGGRGISLVQFHFVPDSRYDKLSKGKKSDGADDSGISLDGGSLKKSNSQDKAEDSSKPSMARSLFSLAGLTRRSESLDGKGKPEIMSINPKEAFSNVKTKLTIKGSNLAISKLDVLKITVCGADCTDSLEFESPSKLVCSVGPVTSPVTGNIMVETSSNGTYSSSMELKLLQDKRETEKFISREKGSGPSPPSHQKSGFIENIKRQHFTSVSFAGDPAPCSQGKENRSRSSLPSTSGPPVLEVMPMVRPKSKKKEEVISALEKRLIESNREIEDLMNKNKKLNEECQRLREYMDLIVSRALIVCPQILSVEAP